MDQRDTAIFMAMPLHSNEEVIAWFDILQTAYAGAPNADATGEFSDAVRQAAGWCDAGAVEAFLRTLESSGEGLAPIARMVADPPNLPDDYWTLYHQWHGGDQTAAAATGDAVEDPFGWLTADQASQFQQAWGNGWRDHLGSQLDYRWGAGWADHPAEHRQHWLGELLDELLAPAPSEAGEEDDDEQDLDALAERMVAETLAGLEDDIEPLSPEEVAEAVAIVRAKLQEEMTP